MPRLALGEPLPPSVSLGYGSHFQRNSELRLSWANQRALLLGVWRSLGQWYRRHQWMGTAVGNPSFSPPGTCGRGTFIFLLHVVLWGQLVGTGSVLLASLMDGILEVATLACRGRWIETSRAGSEDRMILWKKLQVKPEPTRDPSLT